MIAGPSSLVSSPSGTSCATNGSESSEVAWALKERLQVTSGEDTWKLFPVPLKENSRRPLSFRLSTSSITWERLSLSITVCAGAALLLRRDRARSPSDCPVWSDCTKVWSDCAARLTGRSNPSKTSVIGRWGLHVIELHHHHSA